MSRRVSLEVFTELIAPTITRGPDIDEHVGKYEHDDYGGISNSVSQKELLISTLLLHVL
jgi:hypothetical protein